MSDEVTARLGLPLLFAGQAQKELTHNEALALLDGAVQACVEGVADQPPAMSATGGCWIVGDAAAGAWAGHAGAIAIRTAGGWRFVSARTGMQVWHAAAGHALRHVAGRWIVAAGSGPARPAIADPTGGTQPDAEARAAIASVLTALRAHGLIAG